MLRSEDGFGTVIKPNALGSFQKTDTVKTGWTTVKVLEGQYVV